MNRLETNGYSALAGLLDGRPRALGVELVRALATAAVGVGLGFSGDSAAALACGGLVALASATFGLLRVRLGEA